jgi:hypothetical protein
MEAVASVAPELSGRSAKRAHSALAARHAPAPLDLAAARAEFARIMNGVTGREAQV